MQKGEIVLVNFPFTNYQGQKIRPAVVLFSNENDSTLTFITSETKWKTENDIVLKPSKRNGLKEISLVRINKISTIENNLILGQLGLLCPEEIKNLNLNLKKLLQLDT